MALFLIGITLFCLVHLFPALAPAAREKMILKLGENPYKGIYSLAILSGIVMIVFGWKATIPSPLYVPPLGPGILPTVLVFAGLVLFFASQMKGYLKRTLRHPQMIGTLLWAGSHLLTNGDTRSVILFGSLAAWAAFEIVLCNRGQGGCHRRCRWDRRVCRARSFSSQAVRRFAIAALGATTRIRVPPPRLESE